MLQLPVLLFGGTFDPPHRAHVELPFLVAEEIGCDHVVFIPAAMNPLKEERPANAAHRLAMLRLALAPRLECGRASIDTIELDRPGPSYTVDTVEAIHRRLNATAPEDLRLLMGCDGALSFARWRDPARILELTLPVVMLRPPFDRASLREALDDVEEPLRDSDWWMERVVATPLHEVSATEVRRQIAEGERPDELVPRAVAAYIAAHGLYGSGG